MDSEQDLRARFSWSPEPGDSCFGVLACRSYDGGENEAEMSGKLAVELQVRRLLSRGRLPLTCSNPHCDSPCCVPLSHFQGSYSVFQSLFSTWYRNPRSDQRPSAVLVTFENVHRGTRHKVPF